MIVTITNTEYFDNQEVYILGDLNINLLYKEKRLPHGIKAYKEFCALHNLTQIINSPTRITKNTSTLLDHILTNATEKVSQFGVLEIGLSDHQIIFCTRKTKKLKTNTNTFIKIRSLKNYTKEIFLEKLSKIQFPDFSTFIDVDEAYSNFLDKVMKIIDEIAPYKEICIRNNSEEWVDEEIFEGIRVRDKLYKKFKNTRLHTDHVKFKNARNRLQEMIKRKKRNFVTNKLKETIAKPKELWKTLKSLGLPSKKRGNAKVCLKNNGNISFDPKENANIFKTFYENLASGLVDKLPEPTDKFGKNKVKEYYKSLNLDSKNFEFHQTTCDKVTKLLEEINPSKAVGIDNLSGRFLKDGASTLATPLTSLCNLSIKLSKFPDKCKIAKLKALYKKG